ncbi:hypothetical protein RBWH47_05703 [Rhodopirellula baltica WH47]|uniref:Uncharacterized protein n=1 Tax=Rhodopirellula baltica WH47 TaxID=991778 RepID=F2AZI8_RHOBT|nr:hypothetical protein RBWH47_05703 [Rhodopirellula baltica WH47]
MSPLLIVCLFLSLALTVASLLVWQLRRRVRGLHAIVHLLTQRKFYHADPILPSEDEGSDKASQSDDAILRQSLDRLRSVGSRPQ